MPEPRESDDTVKDLFLDLAGECGSRIPTGWVAECGEKEDHEACKPPCPVEEEILHTISDSQSRASD